MGNTKLLPMFWLYQVFFYILSSDFYILPFPLDIWIIEQKLFMISISIFIND